IDRLLYGLPAVSASNAVAAPSRRARTVALASRSPRSMASRISLNWRAVVATVSLSITCRPFCAWSGEVGRKRPCHGEPVPIDLRFQLHQAAHLEADHLGLLVACDQQRSKPAEERHVADERKRAVLGLRSKPLRDRYHR